MRLAISATRAIFALASPPQKWPGAPSVKRKEKKRKEKYEEISINESQSIPQRTTFKLR
jgi:hypothetical protein